MITFKLNVKPKTGKRFRKILETAKDEELFIQTIIENEIKELKKGNLNIHLELKDLEKKYQTATEDFYARFTEGKTDDSEDSLMWAALYETLLKNEKRLKEFE